MRLCCELCNNVATHTYKEWVYHLVSEVHQENAQENVWLWQDEQNQRSLVLTKIPNERGDVEQLQIPLLTFAWHFSKYGIVSDIFIHPSQNFVIIQLEKREQAHKAVMLDPGIIQEITVVLRPKSDLSSEDWFHLSSGVTNKSVNGESNDYFQAKHLWYTEQMENLGPDMQLEKFLNLATMSTSDFQQREKIRTDLFHLIKKEFGDWKIKGVGDVITGLGDAESTLVLHVDMGAHRSMSRYKPEHWDVQIEQVYRLLLAASVSTEKFCKDVLTLNEDRIPSIGFCHCLTNLNVELVFESSIPVYTSKLIQFMISLDPRVLPLMLLIRYWSAYNVQPVNSIPNCTLELLIITFLNSCKILPNVAFLQSKKTTNVPLLENFWDVNFCSNYNEITEILAYSGKAPVEYSDVTSKPTARSILLLARNFFQMYATSDFKGNTLCSLLGNLMPKKDFSLVNSSPTLPRLLQPYRNWALVQNSELDIDSPLCVQDPFNLGKNVASNVTEDALQAFQSACFKSIAVFERLAQESSGAIVNFMDFAIINKVLNATKHKEELLNRSGPSKSFVGKRNWENRPLPASATVTCINVEDGDIPINQSFANRNHPQTDREYTTITNRNSTNHNNYRQLPKSLFDIEFTEPGIQPHQRPNTSNHFEPPVKILRNPGAYHQQDDVHSNRASQDPDCSYKRELPRQNLEPRRSHSTKVTNIRHNQSPIQRPRDDFEMDRGSGRGRGSHVRSRNFSPPNLFQGPVRSDSPVYREDRVMTRKSRSPIHDIRVERGRRRGFVAEAVPLCDVETYELRILHCVPQDFAYCFDFVFANIASRPEIDSRCTSLFALFLKDYFTEIWETAFKLTANLCDSTIILSKLYEPRSKVEYRDFLSENEKRRQRILAGRRENRSFQGDDLQHSEAYEYDDLDEDSGELINSICNNSRNEYSRDFHNRPPDGRFRQLNCNDKYCMSFLVKGCTDIFTEPSLRNVVRRDTGGQIYDLSPLEKEGVVNLEILQRLRHELSYREFIATVKVDLTKQPPELVTIFTETPDCSGMNEIFNNMATIIKGNLNLYQNYRLERWLQL